MNKATLIASAARTSGVSKAAVCRTLDSLTELLAEKMKNGEQVILCGFGVFKAGHHAESEEVISGSDKFHHETMKFYPSFKVSRALKSVLSAE